MTNNPHAEAVINAIINDEYPLDHCKKLMRHGVFDLTLTKDQFQALTQSRYVEPSYFQVLKAKRLKAGRNNDPRMAFQIFGVKFKIKLKGEP